MYLYFPGTSSANQNLSCWDQDELWPMRSSDAGTTELLLLALTLNLPSCNIFPSALLSYSLFKGQNPSTFGIISAKEKFWPNGLISTERGSFWPKLALSELPKVGYFCPNDPLSAEMNLLAKMVSFGGPFRLSSEIAVFRTGLEIALWGLVFLAQKVAFSWLSVDRFGQKFWGLMTLGQVKSIQNFC